MQVNTQILQVSAQTDLRWCDNFIPDTSTAHLWMQQRKKW